VRCSLEQGSGAGEELAGAHGVELYNSVKFDEKFEFSYGNRKVESVVGSRVLLPSRTSYCM
jgi:hypothetical protein